MKGKAIAIISAVVIGFMFLIAFIGGGTTMLVTQNQQVTQPPANTCEKVQQAADLQSSTNPQLAAALKNNANAATMAQFLLLGQGGDLKGLKFSRVMVAGILGNYYQESGVTFARAEEKAGNSHGQLDHMSNDQADSWTQGKDPRGIGIAQWTWNPGRAKTLIDLARSLGKNWYDGDVQIQMMINELSGNYRNSTYNALTGASSPQDAAKIWLAKYEGIPGSSSLPARQQAAMEFYNIFNEQNLGSATTDLAPTNNSGTTAPSTGSGTSSAGDTDDDPACKTQEATPTASAAQYGQIGGAPAIKGDYSWMCDSMKVCKAGDAGTAIGKPYGYQCVWYAWTRLTMIYGAAGWSPITGTYGNGGDIWRGAQADPGNWDVSDTPKPGWGASGTSHPFAGSTHVAVVEEVQPDPSGWKVRLSEGNFTDSRSGGIDCEYGGKACWNGYSGSRWLTKDQMSGVHFFHNKAWKQA